MVARKTLACTSRQTCSWRVEFQNMTRNSVDYSAVAALENLLVSIYLSVTRTRPLLYVVRSFPVYLLACVAVI